MSTETTNYLQEASNDAGETIHNFADEILEQLLDDGLASKDLLNDYPDGDSWHHASHVDKDYSLHDATTILDQLDEFKETDSGLWEGQSLKEAISTCAAYTYGHAVYNEWTELIEKINQDAAFIIDDFDDQITNLEAELESLQAKKKAALEKLIEKVADTLSAL